jgi:hypothetical protein
VSIPDLSRAGAEIIKPIIGRSRALHALALCLSLIALVVQGLAPLCITGMMPHRARGDVFTIVICTTHGLETVKIGADGKPLPNIPAMGGPGSKCPICTDLQTASAWTPAPAIALTLPLDGGRTVLGVTAQSTPVSRPYSSYVTRAPPASSNSTTV